MIDISSYKFIDSIYKNQIITLSKFIINKYSNNDLNNQHMHICESLYDFFDITIHYEKNIKKSKNNLKKVNKIYIYFYIYKNNKKDHLPSILLINYFDSVENEISIHFSENHIVSPTNIKLIFNILKNDLNKYILDIYMKLL